jgi:hypothetical protein
MENEHDRADNDCRYQYHPEYDEQRLTISVDVVWAMRRFVTMEWAITTYMRIGHRFIPLNA